MTRSGYRRSDVAKSQSWDIAVGGLLALAAALGIGRFVYTPILPAMLDALGWSTADAGLVASVNYLGYLVGAVIAGWPVFASAARRWLLIALAVSAVTTAGMGFSLDIYAVMADRFVAGVASAFVMVCASTVVLDRLAAAGRESLMAVHFAGIGAGIFISAAAVAASAASGFAWPSLWITAGLIAAFAGLFTTLLIRPAPGGASLRPAASIGSTKSLPVGMIAAYGLLGFGYVITSTFLVTIVRQSPDVRPLEPWIWMLFGLAAVPSVPLWQYLGGRVGLMRAYALACLVEAIGVAASVDWVTTSGVCGSAVLLGGTFLGGVALGLMSGRALAGGNPQRAISLMTVSFSVGQMIGPSVAGFLAERTGSLQSASRLAAAALVLAAVLAAWPSGQHRRG